MRRRVLLSCSLLAAALAGASVVIADTGPDYLEESSEQDPLAAAFLTLKLPFSEERHNLLHLRSFYMDRSIDNLPNGEEWAAGGWLNVVTDFWQDRIKLGITGYTSQKVLADEDGLSTGLLQPGNQSYSALGEAYGSVTLGRGAVQAGRYLVNLPYINAADTRMTPNTFQGAQAVFELNPRWTLGGGVLTDIKRKTSTDFESLYKAAGLEGDKNVSILASIYETEPGSSAGAYYFNGPDFLEGAYLELNKRFWLNTDGYVQLSTQYTWQQSQGKELGGDIDARHYGLRATWKQNWYSGSLAWTDYPEETRIRSPWGSIPGYTSVMIGDFNRPEETAWLVGGSADLAAWGAKDFKLNLKYVAGDTPDCGTSASPDRDEWDLNLTYTPRQTAVAGLTMRLRLGWVNQQHTCGRNNGVDIADLRFIVNYPLEF